MTKLLRILALLAALGVVSSWLLLGADRGWSKTAIPVKKTDPVTEIEYVEYDRRFVPGVDFLAAGLLGSAALFAVSLFLPKLQTKSNS